MSELDQVCKEFASSSGRVLPRESATKRPRGASVPRAMKSAEPVTAERERPAIEAYSTPKHRASAAQSSATPAKVKRGRQANSTVQPTSVAPADQSSASGGADETNDALPPANATSRRQNSRVVHRSGDIQIRTDSAEPAPTNDVVFTGTTASEPDQFTNDAGHRTTDVREDTSRVRCRNQTSIETQRLGVPAAQDPAGSSGGGDDGARPLDETQSLCLPIIAEIVALHRMRIRWLKAELKLVLQAQAICRQWTDGDKTEAAALYRTAEAGKPVDPAVTVALGPFLAALKPFRAEGEAYDKRLAKLARQLPVWPWVKGVWGFSDIGLAKIVGEAGDVGSYRNPSCLWKRLGLAVIDGQRQRRMADADAALLHGYSPGRRSMMWNIGNGLIGGMGNGVRPAVGEDWQARTDWTPYQKLYVGRLIYEAERNPEHMARPATAAGKMSFSKHAHNRAKRYIEKRALRDLWSAWLAADRGQFTTEDHLPNAPVGPTLMAAE